MKTVLIRAKAKINLDFKILGKFPNGFHRIESTFQSVDLSDFLFLEKAEKDELTGSIICPFKQNIILKAKQALEKDLRKSLPCKIHLQKSIPVAAGLGGGSADAAAVLFGLNRLYNLNLSSKELAKIGFKTGSDLPFFFYGGTCRVEGSGQKISKVKKKLPAFFILFRPHKRIETKKVYSLYDRKGKSFLEINRKICPDVKKVEKYFSGFNLKASLSGSGPTMFCRAESFNLAKKIAEGYPDFNGDIFICRPQKKALEVIG
jgi:4-diphosphocytidyl-2-C-methyl-D-erythritol kinase